MISSLKPFLDVLGMPVSQFMVPVFQRVYSWTNVQCRQLWEDIINASTNDKNHFVGTFIYKEESPIDCNTCTSAIRRFSIIDGQQRLTTVTLLITALRDKLKEKGDPRAEILDKHYLHAAPDLLKLILSSEDADTLAYIIDKKSLPPDVEPSRFLNENYKTFADLLSLHNTDIEVVIHGIHCLSVVAVMLDDNDSPQQVFESLNTKGRPLSTIDLLRNILIKEYGYDKQERLLDTYWAPIEDAYKRFDKEKDLYLDAALHCWISKTSPELHAAKRADLYQAFKTYLQHHNAQSLEDTLASINKECLEFASKPHSPEAKIHIDWAIEKPTGSMMQKKLFGD